MIMLYTIVLVLTTFLQIASSQRCTAQPGSFCNQSAYPLLLCLFVQMCAYVTHLDLSLFCFLLPLSSPAALLPWTNCPFNDIASKITANVSDCVDFCHSIDGCVLALWRGMPANCEICDNTCWAKSVYNPAQCSFDNCMLAYPLNVAMSVVSPLGRYSPSAGLTAALPCPAGRMCNTTGLTTPGFPCPLGSYSPTTGYSACATCPLGSYCPSAGMTMAISCPVWTISLSAGATSAAVCSFDNFYGRAVFSGETSTWTSTGSSSWTPSSNTTLWVDVLIVAGGGGAGYDAAGGGGGGGVVYLSWYPVTVGQLYSVTVGIGGAASTATSVAGSPGGNSSFNGIVARGGGAGIGTYMNPTLQLYGGSVRRALFCWWLIFV
jgi:hypothetical protein